MCRQECGLNMIIKKFLKKYGWLYIPGVIFLALCSRITTLAPKALGDAIDLLEQVVPDESLVWKQAGLIILIAVAIFVTRFIWRMMIIRNARSMECFLREELFVKLQNMPISFFSASSLALCWRFCSNMFSLFGLSSSPSSKA